MSHPNPMQEAVLAGLAGMALLTPDPAVLAPLLEDARESGALTEEQALAWRRGLAAGPRALEQEYVHLFLNPTGAPCRLWQSACAESPQLMGAAHDDALRWYRRYGFEPKTVCEPADHAGLLLLFYSRLLASDETDDALVEQFRKEHLEWLGILADTLRRHARGALYPLLTDVLAQWACAEVPA